jgi:hypothetical protein
MKKDLIFAPILLIVGVLLFLYDLVGEPAHIAVAVVGVLVLAAYTAATKKAWKIPALEIIMRAFYGIALITGAVVMNVKGVAPLAIAHKACGALFLVALIVLFVHKAVTAKKN